jgi:hypothetical protein
MPIIPAANFPLTARIIKSIGNAVKQFVRGANKCSPLAKLLETQALNFLHLLASACFCLFLVEGLSLPVTDRQPLNYLVIREDGDYSSQSIPASQRILNFGDSLNCVSGRIISPFHKTVKIWSSHLDIRPADHQFLSVFGSSATIRAVSKYQRM